MGQSEQLPDDVWGPCGMSRFVSGIGGHGPILREAKAISPDPTDLTGASSTLCRGTP